MDEKLKQAAIELYDRFTHEGLDRRVFVSRMVALAGSVLVTFTEGAGGESRLYGNLLALGGAVAMACYFLLGRRLRPHLIMRIYLPTYLPTCSAWKCLCFQTLNRNPNNTL